MEGQCQILKFPHKHIPSAHYTKLIMFKSLIITIDFSEADTMQTVSNQDVSDISKKLLKKNKRAYEELAK